MRIIENLNVTYLADPLSTPAHFFRNQEVGGVFTRKLNVRFENANK